MDFLLFLWELCLRFMALPLYVQALLVLASPVWLLWPAYIVGIQIENTKKGGWWLLCYLLAPITFVALILDWAMNYTLLRWYLQSKPEKGERTFSKHLKRLMTDPGWRGHVARWIERYMLAWADPDGYHAVKPS